jgi:hypothetical protein
LVCFLFIFINTFFFFMVQKMSKSNEKVRQVDKNEILHQTQGFLRIYRKQGG